jgi:16S rRNA (uracil1498-N3)-methyltransferase
MIRLFVQGPLMTGQTVDATPEQARYLTGVMRLTAGESLLLFNGRDGEWRATVSDVTKRGCRLSPQERVRPQTLPDDLELVMALVKRGPLELVIEKATELGVGRIRLVTTRRTNTDHTNVSRLTAIATEAAEQCERLEVPQIDPPEKLDRLLDSWPGDRKLIFCDEANARAPDKITQVQGPVRSVLEAVRSDVAASWSILVGPEGGFDPVERARLRDHPAVIPVTLGPLILRAETAALSALVLSQAGLAEARRA